MWSLHLKELTKEDDQFTTKLHRTDWLAHVEGILTQAFKAASILISGTANVFVYCQTGTQATPLLTSLTQVICDPAYRTFDGLKTLIHKEWLYFRYNFQAKLQILPEKQPTDRTADPTFVLFLDALFQLQQMNPFAFQYTGLYLAFLAAELFTNRWFEFVQADKFDQSDPAPSVFGPEHRLPEHSNLNFDGC